MEYIDVFAGAGGASLGLHQAGLIPRLAVELDPACAMTHQLNFPACPVALKNLFLYPIEDVLLAEGIRPDWRGLIWLSPPCQGHSTAGEGGGEEDLRNSLLDVVVQAANYLSQSWVVMENVPGLATRDSKPMFDALLAELSGLERDVRHFILNPIDYGLSQDRPRLIVIAAPVGGALVPDLTPEFEVTPSTVAADLEKLSIKGDRDRDFPPMPANERRLNAGIPDGGSAEDSDLGRMYAKKLGRNPKALLKRTNSKDPWPTITASQNRGKSRVSLIHPTELRYLSIGEMREAMGFPDDYVIAGDTEQRHRQVGNAVVPAIAKLIGEAVLKASGMPEMPC